MTTSRHTARRASPTTLRASIPISTPSPEDAEQTLRGLGERGDGVCPVRGSKESCRSERQAESLQAAQIFTSSDRPCFAGDSRSSTSSFARDGGRGGRRVVSVPSEARVNVPSIELPEAAMTRSNLSAVANEQAAPITDDGGRVQHIIDLRDDATLGYSTTFIPLDGLPNSWHRQHLVQWCRFSRDGNSWAEACECCYTWGRLSRSLRSRVGW